MSFFSFFLSSFFKDTTHMYRKCILCVYVSSLKRLNGMSLSITQIIWIYKTCIIYTRKDEEECFNVAIYHFNVLWVKISLFFNHSVQKKSRHNLWDRWIMLCPPTTKVIFILYFSLYDMYKKMFPKKKYIFIFFDEFYSHTGIFFITCWQKFYY